MALVRQSLVESLLLSLCGGIAGLLIAIWATQAAIKALPIPFHEHKKWLSTLGSVFTVSISVLTGIFRIAARFESFSVAFQRNTKRG
jgi:ABC-type antimicrobial peptide transport system permease subunit